MTLADINKEVATHQRTLGQMDSRFSALEAAVAARESEAKTLKSRLDAANKVPDDVEPALQALATGRERLATIEQRVGGAQNILDGAQTTLITLVKAEARAKSEDERLDQQHARIDKLKADIDKLTPDIDKLRPEAEASASIVARSKTAREALAQLEDAVKAAEDRLKQLDSEIKAMTTPTGPSKPPPTEPTPLTPKTEKDLDVTGWKAIQRALTAFGHQPGTIDGKPGAKIRAAIQRFQRSRSDTSDGKLTIEQIDVLLKSAAVSRKQSAAHAD